MLFDTSIDYENEHIYVNFLGDDFEKYESFKICFVDIFNNLTFYVWDMPGPHMYCWPGKSFSCLNGIKILIFDKEGKTLLHIDTYDFNLPNKKTIYIDNTPLRFFGDVQDPSQWWAFNEVVVQDCYGFYKNLIKEDDVVVDIGANIGLFSLSALSRGAKKIFSIESMPHVFDHLYSNTYIYNNIKCFNNAISKSNDVIDFYIPKTGSGVSTSFLESSWIDDSDVKIQCQGITFDKFLSDENIEYIDCLKIDCEGAEWDLIESNIDFINDNVGKLEIEVHPWGYKNKIETTDQFKQIYTSEIVDKLNKFDIIVDDNTDSGLIPIGLHATNYRNIL